jgi:hypothetical protein
MADRESTHRPRGGKPAGILSRDDQGREHRLRVTERGGAFITLFDDEFIRLLSPPAATELVMHLLHELAKLAPPPP